MKPAEQKALITFVRKQGLAAQQALDRELITEQKACQAGCDACCHQMVYVHTWEVEGIKQFLATMHADTKKIVRRQLVEWWKIFISITRRPTQATPLNHIEQMAIQRVMRERRIPCSFLVNQQCSIYSVRSAVCRSHYVASDPVLCRSDPHRNGDPAGVMAFGKVFGAESAYLPRDRFPHAMLPLFYVVTEEFKLAVPSTPMEGRLLGDVSL